MCTPRRRGRELRLAAILGARRRPFAISLAYEARLTTVLQCQPTRRNKRLRGVPDHPVGAWAKHFRNDDVRVPGEQLAASIDQGRNGGDLAIHAAAAIRALARARLALNALSSRDDSFEAAAHELGNPLNALLLQGSKR